MQPCTVSKASEKRLIGHRVPSLTNGKRCRSPQSFCNRLYFAISVQKRELLYLRRMAIRPGSQIDHRGAPRMNPRFFAESPVTVLGSL